MKRSHPKRVRAHGAHLTRFKCMSCECPRCSGCIAIPLILWSDGISNFHDTVDRRAFETSQADLDTIVIHDTEPVYPWILFG